MSDPAPEINAAIARATRRLAFLHEAAEVGMEMVREFREAFAADPDRVERAHGFVKDYEKLARAIRLTLTLEMRTESALAAMWAGAPPPPDEPRRTKPRRAAGDGDESCETETLAAAERRERLRDMVMRLAESEPEERFDLAGLEQAIDARLDEEDRRAGTSAEAGPLRETARKICADLKITPERRRWGRPGRRTARPASGPGRPTARAGPEPPA